MSKDIEIFKVQRPLIGGDEVLIYNEDRSVMGQFPPSNELLNMFDEDEYKIYVVGFYNDKTKQTHINSKLDNDVVEQLEIDW